MTSNTCPMLVTIGLLTCLGLASTSGAATGGIAVTNLSVVPDAPLDQLKLRGTHNSYQRSDRDPETQIDSYNIWAIELDFGMLEHGGPFIVGHDGPEPDAAHGLYYLREWIANLRGSVAAQAHPIILKLEAKIHDSCDNPFCPLGCCWEWADSSKWDDWGPRLRDELHNDIGDDHWFTKTEFLSPPYNGTWPGARELAGQIIVQLIWNSTSPLPDDTPAEFFVGSVDGLADCGPESGCPDSKTFAQRVEAGGTAIFWMDDWYKEGWSNVLVTAPRPSYVLSHTGWQWGTRRDPFNTLGSAAASARLGSMGEADSVVLENKTYPERVTLDTPLTLVAAPGGATVGGTSMAYALVLRFADVHEAGTGSPVYVQLHGTNGDSGEMLLRNPMNYFGRGGAEEFWFYGNDYGQISSVKVRVGGSDDFAIHQVMVAGGRYARRSATFDTLNPLWVGNDHVNPATIALDRK